MATVRDRFIRVRSDDERSAASFARRAFARDFGGALPIQGRRHEFAVWKPDDFPLREPQCDACGTFQPPLSLHEGGDRVLCPRCGACPDSPAG